MYRLTAPETCWVDFADAGLPGLKVQFAPPDRATLRAARLASASAFEAAEADKAPNPGARAEDAFVRALVEPAIRAWEGVAGEDDKPLPVTPETVARFCANAVLLDAAARLYAYPIMSLEASRASAKKASSPSRNGSSGTRAKPTAKGARSPAAAKPARSGSTGSKTRTSPSPGK